MKKLLIFVLLVIAISISKANAGNFVCSKVYPPFSTYLDRGDRSSKIKRTYYQITRSDLVQAYSGKPVFMNNAWLTVVILPRDSVSTRAAYSELDLSMSVLDRILDSSTILDLSIRVVQTEGQLLDVVSENPPAVGYTSLYQGKFGPVPCFPQTP